MSLRSEIEMLSIAKREIKHNRAKQRGSVFLLYPC